MKVSRLAPVLLLALAATAACSQEPEVLAVPVDDAATPVGSGGPQLSSGFDRDLAQLAAALPVDPLEQIYSEVQVLPTETLRVAETNVCRRGDGELALPATEVLATRRPPAGHHQPESADVVAARAQSEFTAGQFTDEAFATMQECTRHTVRGRDLGEGSYAPGEKISAKSEDVSYEGWAGVRHTARVTLTSNTWKDDVVREWVLVRQGQIVISVKVEGFEAAEVSRRADAVIASTTDVLDGRSTTPAALQAPAGSPTGEPTGSPTGTASATGSASASTSGPAKPTATGSGTASPEPTGSPTSSPSSSPTAEPTVDDAARPAD